MRPAVLAAAVCLAACGTSAAAPVLGAFQGTGRACSGSLRVTAKTLAWKAAFTNCGPVAYRALEPAGKGRAAYALARQSASCPFAVVEVERMPEAAGMWNVTGHPTLAAYQAWREGRAGAEAQLSPDALSCPMTGPK